MKTFSIFVDGSNLMGSLRKVGISVDDYQGFFKFVFEEGIKVWRSCLPEGFSNLSAMLQRTHWYVLGSIDYCDTASPSFKKSLEDIFMADSDLKRKYITLSAPSAPALDNRTQAMKHKNAWDMCFNEVSSWYKAKSSDIKKFTDFYEILQKNTDFIDIIKCGHWKVDLLNKQVIEKGLDTQLAVDIVMSAPAYDVALVISGDADHIPSFNHVKKLGKQIGSVEFIKGHPPEERGRQFSSRLKAASDFVVQIYETDLERRGLAKKR